jgi:hypothetical protein
MARPPLTKPVTIRFTGRTYERMHKHLLRDENEEFCFLFAHVVENPKRRIFLVDKMVNLDPACYLRRTRTSIVIDPRAKNALYSRFVQSPYTGLINVHSHPFDRGAVHFSGADDCDDLYEMAYQYEQFPRGKRRLGQKAKVHVLSMVFGQKSLDARGYRPGLVPTLPTIEQVQVLGEPLRFITPTGAGNPPSLSSDDLSTYDRQLRAFGKEGQRTHAQLRVCLVGCGGIGSILAENLTRQGVKNLTLIDHDLLSPDSLNRWQGGRPSDVGKPKVRVLARLLKTMVPGIKVTPIVAPLTAPKALAALKACDVLIGAVDNHITRWLLNRVATQYLIPYLDAATVITKGEDNGGNDSVQRMHLLSRLGVVVPGTTACLDCSQVTYYDKKQIALHLYDPQTRANLYASGYIKDHPEVTSPSVMFLNMQAGAAVLIELMNLVTGFHPLARYTYLDWLNTDSQILRADSSTFPEGPSVDCLNCAGFLGAGDSEPLPAIDEVLDIDNGSQIDNFIPIIPIAANES